MTTSSIQRPPEQVEQRPQPDVNKQAEPVAPPKRRMMIIASALILIVAGDVIFGGVVFSPRGPSVTRGASGRVQGVSCARAVNHSGDHRTGRAREEDASKY